MSGMPQNASYRVCFVCSGNICRSPIAEAVLRTLAARAGLAEVSVDSAGTGDWHVGQGADPRAQRVLAAAGYDGSLHRARRFERSWFADRDLVVALDAGHLRTLRAWAPDDATRAGVRLLRGYDADAVAAGDLDVPDPYYDDDAMFALVLAQIESACAGLVGELRAVLHGPARVTGAP